MSSILLVIIAQVRPQKKRMSMLCKVYSECLLLAESGHSCTHTIYCGIIVTYLYRYGDFMHA